MKSKNLTTSKDNIFEDLGFNKSEAENLKIRAELMIIIKRYIEKNKLTQKEAAKRMRVDQPRINKLLKGQIELFTIDSLIQMLAAVGIIMKLKKAA